MKGRTAVNKVKALFRGAFMKARGIWEDEEKRKELIWDIVFGLLTTAVNYAVYWVMRNVTGMDHVPRDSGAYRVRANVSNLTAWVLSVFFAFVTNKKYVFRSGKRIGDGAGRELTMFFMSRAASYLIFDLALFTVCLYVMPDLADKLLMNVLVVIFNYFMSKIVVFR